MIQGSSVCVSSTRMWAKSLCLVHFLFLSNPCYPPCHPQMPPLCLATSRHSMSIDWMHSELGNEPLSHLCGCFHKYLGFNLGPWLCWMSFRHQSVVTAVGTPHIWLLEHFDKKHDCVLRYLRAPSCFSQTQLGFHVVFHLLIDTQYFSRWAKCGNTLFIWHCGNPFTWMEKNILVKWNWCLVAMHTHPNNLPLDPVHGPVLQLLDAKPYSCSGIYFPWPCWDTKTNFPIQLQPRPPAPGQ